MALSLSEGSAHRCLAPHIMSGHCQWEHGKEALHLMVDRKQRKKGPGQDMRFKAMSPMSYICN